MLLGFLFIIALAIFVIPGTALILAGWFTTTPIGTVLSDAINYVMSFGLGIIILAVLWLVFVVLQLFMLLLTVMCIDGRGRNPIIAFIIGTLLVTPAPFLTWLWILPYGSRMPASVIEWALSVLFVLILVIRQHANPEGVFTDAHRYPEMAGRQYNS
jgi:hypothetical protein